LGFTPGFQPTMVPSSVANRNTAAAEVAVPVFVKPLILNPPVGPPSVLNTVPVGVPSVPRGAGGLGMLTTSACGTPAVLESVDTPALLSEIQKGLPLLVEMPHGLTRWGSICCATPGRSDTKFVCRTLDDSRQRASKTSGVSAYEPRRRGTGRLEI